MGTMLTFIIGCFVGATIGTIAGFVLTDNYWRHIYQTKWPKYEKSERAPYEIEKVIKKENMENGSKSDNGNKYPEWW